ncbi:EXS, C-terminal [Dillenia turbinata]|uniref:EXS, C-terminal n=1 Tax=Dillenia turbinata TaxID=194707 RepID=A0AAN8Z2E1_9MAGN
MKFGKEFKRQMVPEWTEAHVDYNGLKRILREILRFKQTKEPGTPLRDLQRRLSLYRAFSGLTRESNDLEAEGDTENQVIAVNMVQQEDSRKFYKTKFLMPSEEGMENEVIFFKKLDDELNKVNTFYKDKVEEMIKEAALLDKQMEALIALRIRVENPNFDGPTSTSDGTADTAANEPDPGSSTLSRGRVPGGKNVEFAIGGENSRNIQQESSDDTERDHIHVSSSGSFGTALAKNVDHKAAVSEILERVKINNTLETPMSTIKGILTDSREEDLSFKKEEVNKVEEQMRHVFIEFYQKLRLLKHYSFMNLSAFSKIMKKYEKITSRGASRSYMKTVDNSYLGSSDEITILLERVEATFIKHFSKSNRREGMKMLRPKAKRERHRITFFSGFFSGCSIALLMAIILSVHARNIMKKEGTLYMENISMLYRQTRTSLKLHYFSKTSSSHPPLFFLITFLYAYIVLHMLMYAANIYFWKRYRINYPFIFNFKQGTELSYREVFLLSTGLSVLAMTSLLAHLHMDLDTGHCFYKTISEMIPLALISVVLLITFCPFNIIYRSSRFFLIQCMFHCICAPLYKVTLPDFFLADNLTSQVQAIRSLEYYICYYGWEDSSRIKNKCHSRGVYNAFYFIVAVIPYWARFMQCLRRLFEEKDPIHGYNGLKYFLTIVAVVIRTSFELKKGISWKVFAFLSSAIATIMNTYWDIVMDWGLLQRHSKNIGLRDKLVVSHRSVYFAAMFMNVILRIAWLQLVLILDVSTFHGKAMSMIFPCLEILRRGIWSFFRLENEHLNNVGKYRAFKSVPLPFNYYDADINKDD